jgi:hypothetical protein
MTGVLSSSDVDLSFSSAWGGVVDASQMRVVLISAYSGKDYNANTWSGDTYADGWLGLAKNADPSFNILQRLKAMNEITNMIFYMTVDWGGSSRLYIG